MTDSSRIRTSPPPPGASCSRRSAVSTRPSSRARAQCRTTGTSPTATARSRPPSASRFDTYLFAEPQPARSSSTSTRRSGATGAGAATTPTPTTSSRRSTRTRRYRISGNRGDSVYFSLTAYNEPSPGAWSDKVVAIVNDTDLEFDADGNFSFDLGPLPDAAVLMTRDYQVDPLTGRPLTWHIEALDEPDPVAARRRRDRRRPARRRAAWLRTMFAIMPLSVGVRSDDEHNAGHEIAQVANTFGDALPGARRQLRLVGARRLLLVRQL